MSLKTRLAKLEMVTDTNPLASMSDEELGAHIVALKIQAGFDPETPDEEIMKALQERQPG